MRLTIIGSGTCIPSLKRGGPSTLVQTRGKNLLIDMGTGTLHKMLELGLTIRDIDLILFSHTHPDHTAELVSFLFACKYHEEPREKPLQIIGGRGFVTFFDTLKVVYGKWLEPDRFELTVSELVDDTMMVEGIRLASAKTLHTRESVGFRLESEGRAVAISGDTEYCEGIVTLGRSVDLLVLECSMPDGKEMEGHLTPSSAARIARETGCKRLLVTHMYPSCETSSPESAIKKNYPGEVIMGEDRMRITL